MPESDALTTAARELYAGPAKTFIARRNDAVASAREQGDAALARAIASLRRPTAAAAAVNALPAADIDALSDLAGRLRTATSTQQMDDLKQLGIERTRLIASIVEDLDVSPAVANEVRATLTAALSDPQAEAAVRSRTLVRSLSYSGFGVAEMQSALAVPTLRVVRAPQELEEARTAVDVARRRKAAAAEAAEAAQAALDRATADLTAAEHRVQQLQREAL